MKTTNKRTQQRQSLAKTKKQYKDTLFQQAKDLANSNYDPAYIIGGLTFILEKLEELEK